MEGLYSCAETSDKTKRNETTNIFENQFGILIGLGMEVGMT